MSNEFMDVVPKKVLDAHNKFPLKNKATLVSGNEGKTLNVHFNDEGIANQYQKHIESHGLFPNHKKTSPKTHTFKVHTSAIEKNDQEMTQKLVGDLLDDNSKAQVNTDGLNKNEYLDEKQVSRAIIQKATEILDDFLNKAEKKEKPKLIGSHGTKEGLHEGIKKYFYSPNIELKDNGDGTHSVHNSNGKIDGVQVREHKGRWKFERLPKKESELAKARVDDRSVRNDREAAGFGVPHPKDGRVGSEEISVKFVGNPKTAKLRGFLDKKLEKKIK
jgi:hypothetical protein